MQIAGQKAAIAQPRVRLLNWQCECIDDYIESMAATGKRRWYQFSLKALLILMAVASLPPGAYAVRRQYLIAKRLAEMEGAFRWLESLDYPDMPNGQPVLVTTISRSKDRETPFVEKPGLAFLLNEDAKSFAILTPSLEPKTIERKRDLGESYIIESSFERTSLAVSAADSLERMSDPFSGGPFDVLTDRGQLLVLAWACARHGCGEWAIKLYDAAEASTDYRELKEAKNLQEVKAKSFLERAAADFDYRETRKAIADCGSKKPRLELLKKFRWIEEHFPNSKYAKEVKQKVAILAQMVAEDVVHDQRRAAGPPFEQLSKHEQIEELIFQLRDRSIDYYACYAAQDQSAPFERLKTYGYEAIPQLAAALSDKSLTRSIDRLSSSDSSIGNRVCTVGEFVDSLLMSVAGRGFDPGEPVWGHSARSAALQDAKRIEAMQTAALEWHKQLVTKGEEACLVEVIRELGPHWNSLARHLGAKDPDTACGALLEAAVNATDEKQFSISNIFRWMHTDKSLPFLLSQLEHDRGANRLEAAEALTNLGRSEGIAAMIEQWQRSEDMAELKWVSHFLIRSGNASAIRAVAKRFLQQPIEMRAATMYEASRDANPKLASSDELRTAMIELLLVALRDTETQGESSGNWGGPSIAGLRICDMAGYHLNQIDPAAFRFNIEAPLDKRELARRQILLANPNDNRPALKGI